MSEARGEDNMFGSCVFGKYKIIGKRRGIQTHTDTVKYTYQWIPPGNVLSTTGHVPNTNENPPYDKLVTSVSSNTAKCPKALNTANPAIKLNMQFEHAMTKEFTTTGSVVGQ